jgi:hypothetical protein
MVPYKKRKLVCFIIWLTIVLQWLENSRNMYLLLYRTWLKTSMLIWYEELQSKWWSFAYLRYIICDYRNNPTLYKLKDSLHFLQLPCFYIWTPYQASLRYAYKVGRSYPAGSIFRSHSKSVTDLYFAPTRSALPSSSILKIISVGKCELYSEKYSYLWNLWA